MHCLSDGEAAAWCRAQGYPVLATGPYGRPAPGVDEEFEFVTLDYPVDSGQRLALVRSAIECLGDEGDLLIWITDWSAWPSSQHMALFSRFREAFGESRPLIEAPAHLLGPTERDDAVSVLLLATLFYWDCYAFPISRGPVFHASHDEWSGFFLPPGTSPEVVVQPLSKWLADAKRAAKERGSN